MKEIGSCAESQRRRRRQSFSYKSSLRCWELIYIRDSAVLFITNSLKMNRDPATETVVENNRQGIVALGPVQPRTITFPSSGSRNLKFQASWFAREDYSQWLEYSISKDSAFCFVCRCFGNLVGCSDKQFIENGFHTWGKALGENGTFAKHLKSRMHMLSTERYVRFTTTKHVDEQLGDQMKADKNRRDAEKAENRSIVLIIMDCLLFLAKQGLAFRGHVESNDSNNRGNFIELLHFLSKYEPKLKQWMDKHPGNVSYLSSEIQNEMLHIAAEQIRQQIAVDVCKSRYFSLVCDEVSDISNTEWITVVLRYTKNEEIVESLIAIVPTLSLTAAVLCDKVVMTLKEFNISTDMIVGQCYDGVSNMSGQYGGLQAKVNEIAGNKAVYIHCYAHALNLVVSNTMQNNRMAADIFGVLQKLYAFIERTPKRHHTYIECLEKQATSSGTVITGKKILQTLSNTRWSARADNLDIACNCLPAIASALQLFPSDPDATGLLHSVTRFTFVFGIHVLNSVLKYCKSASDYLQTEDLDLVAALQSVSDLTSQMQSMRSDECFERIWSESANFCSDNQSSGFLAHDDPSLQPRKRKVPKSLVGSVLNTYIGISESEGATLKDDMRVNFYFTVLDEVLANMSKRFDGRSAIVMKGVASLHLGSTNCSSIENATALKEFAQHYGIDVDKCLCQYQLIASNTVITEAKPRTLKDVWRLLVSSNMRVVYPEFGKAFQIAVTLPVTSASAERVHSKLKLIKTCSRSTSADVRSADLIQIYVECIRSSDLLLDDLVTAFAAKPRKLSL